MVFWSEPTTTAVQEEEKSTPPDTTTPIISEPDAPLDADDTKDESGGDEDAAAVTWADVDQLSAAVLASIPRTATAKLAAAVALLSYLVYMKARLDKCVA